MKSSGKLRSRFSTSLVAAGLLTALVLVEVFIPNRRDQNVLGNPQVPEYSFAHIFTPTTLCEWLYPMVIAIATLNIVIISILKAYFLHRGAGRSSGKVFILDQQLGALSIGISFVIIWTIFTAKLNTLPWSIAPPPILVLQSFGTDIGGHSLAYHLVVRSRTAICTLLIALALATPLAIIFGLVLGQAKHLAKFIVPYVQIISALPPIVLYPLVKLLFYPLTLRQIFHLQDGQLPQWIYDLLTPAIIIILTGWAIFWPVFAAAFDGARMANQRLISAASLAGASWSRRLRSVVLPQAANQIFTNLPIALVMGMIVMLFAQSNEGSNEGGSTSTGLVQFLFTPSLGALIADVNTEKAMAELLDTVVAVLLLVIIFNQLIKRLKHRFAPWLKEKESGIQSAVKSPIEPDVITADKDVEDKIIAYHLRFEELLEKHRRKDPDCGTIKVSGLEASFNNFSVAAPDLKISKGEFVSIIGESGGGKSTLAELVAGLSRPANDLRGTICVNGLTLYNNNEMALVEPAELGVSFVHQDYALFPHMTVKQNIAFFLQLRIKRITRSAHDRHAVSEISQQEIVKLGIAAIENVFLFLGLSNDNSILKKYPQELSGGQQQRVALARSLLINNPILVMDEGLSNIDQPRKGNIRDGIRRLSKRLELTVIAISHDNQDVLRTSDRIVYMERNGETGRVVANMTPNEFYYAPVSDRAARFIGHRNLYRGVVSNEDKKTILSLFPLDSEMNREQVESIRLPLEDNAQDDTKNGIAMVPSTWVNLHFDQQSATGMAKVVDESFLGGQIELKMMLSGGFIIQAVVQDDDYQVMLKKLNVAAGTNHKSLEKIHSPIPFRIEGTPRFVGCKTN